MTQISPENPRKQEITGDFRASAVEILGEAGSLVRNITLFAVLVYELVGPLLTRWALTKAGDIKPTPEHIKNRRQAKLEAAGKR